MPVRPERLMPRGYGFQAPAGNQIRRWPRGAGRDRRSGRSASSCHRTASGPPSFARGRRAENSRYRIEVSVVRPRCAIYLERCPLLSWAALRPQENDAGRIHVSIVLMVTPNAGKARTLPTFFRKVSAFGTCLRSVLRVNADHGASGPCCPLADQRFQLAKPGIKHCSIQA
jgi:hypothetical protein